MRFLIISLVLAFLSGCASTYNPQEDRGTVCRLAKDSNEQICLPVQYDYDPTRFHYLTPWQRDRLPSMPNPL